MKKVLGIVLAAAMLLSSVSLAGFSVAFLSIQANAGGLPTYPEATSKEVGPAEENHYKTGDHIQFGTYPQTRVTNDSLIAKLDAAEKTWKSYGYYSGTGNEADGKMVPGDFMNFADFFCDKIKYRAVTFSEYRPQSTGSSHIASSSCQDENGYFPGNVYYFVYEPLNWRILDASAGLLMCELAVDSQTFQNTVCYADDYYWQDDSKGHFANDYATSSLNTWLNYDFYETAFTKTQKDNIKKPVPPLNNKSAYSSVFDSASTDDKIYLLSYAEVTNSDYGFNSSGNTPDPARRAKGTDYAKCQGIYVHPDVNSQLYQNVWCWLRSPAHGSYYACHIDNAGYPYVSYPASVNNIYGVRPACCLVTLKSDSSQSNTLFSEMPTAENTAWQDDEALGLANFTVVNAQTLKPLNGATITVKTADGTKTATTDANGKVSLVLPVGKQQVTASYPGCIARTLNIKIEHKENDIPAIGLSDKPVVDATLTSKVMNYDEITKAGIDVMDPDNYNVVKYKATFVFEAEGGKKKVESEYIISDGDTYVPNGNGGWKKGGGIYVPENNTVIYPSEKFYLVVSGEVKWLKEMFDVQMYIWNNSNTDTLENLNATLTLPDGLSLAAMTDGEQSAAQYIDKIAEGGSAVAQWFVRGDKAGKYSLSATLTGTVMPFEEDFTNTYTSDDTITVYGTGALQFTFKSPETFTCGEDYYITISLTNVSKHTLYNVSHMITGVDAFKVEQFKKGASVPVKVKHPGATFNPYAFDAEMAPGDHLDLTFSVTIDPSEFYNRVFQLTDFFFESDALVTAIHENFGYSKTHSFGDWKNVPAEYPCQAGKRTRECKNCGFVEEESIPGTGKHTPGEPVETVTQSANCTKAGEKTVTVKCVACGVVISEKKESIPANGEHVWDEGTISEEPTCQQRGLKLYLCEVCGELKKEYLPKVDHDLHHVVNPATCTLQGAEYDACSTCDATFNYTVIPMLPHPWDGGKVIKAATCKTEGEAVFTCTVCSATKTEPIPVNDNHTWNDGEITTPATCQTDGVKTFTCTLCGKTRTETIPAGGGEHQWDEGKVTKDSTCKEPGEMTYTCTLCGATKTGPAPLGEHSFGPWKFLKVPNYREGGSAQRTCKVCGFVETKEYDRIIPDILQEDDVTDVVIGYMNDTYENDVDLKVTNVFDGSSYNVLSKEKTNFQFAIYDISTMKDGLPVQPSGNVLVKLPIPADYSRDHLVVYYVTNTGTVEKVDMWIEGDFACFEAEHFSVYALVDEAKEVIRLGDVDGDGEISSADARLALRCSVKLEAYAQGTVPYRACDVDLDGEVSSSDARSILRVSVKLEKEADWKK